MGYLPETLGQIIKNGARPDTAELKDLYPGVELDSIIRLIERCWGERSIRPDIAEVKTYTLASIIFFGI